MRAKKHTPKTLNKLSEKMLQAIIGGDGGGGNLGDPPPLPTNPPGSL